MGRKKKKPLKPWCWYCNREFDDDKILTQHQRAKHYKCPFCHKKLYSGPGLTVHCVQVHKEKLDKIPEALPNRNSVDIDIYGMQGIPEEDLREHERLKRGDDGRSKPEQESKVQASKSHGTNYQKPLLPPPPLGLPSNPMHAAMFQHAMSMGMMPPGFGVPPGGPPLSLPPGLMPPPGFPGMPPPTMHAGMPLPPLHPGMPVPQLHPGMPPPLGFPHMLPPTSSSQYQAPPMGFHGPPPPPPPPDEPSTSNAQLPPPMSGAGSLLGLPFPNFKQAELPPPIKPQGDIQQELKDSNPVIEVKASTASQQSTGQSSPTNNLEKGNALTASTVSTIAKPAVITNSENTSLVIKDYIDIPSSKARIMHPSENLSLEEMRLRLTKYKHMT